MAKIPPKKEKNIWKNFLIKFILFYFNSKYYTSENLQKSIRFVKSNQIYVVLPRYKRFKSPLVLWTHISKN